LQESIDDLAEMAKDSSLKPNGRVDLQLRRADAILSLAKLSADKADSDALAENETLKQERAALYEQLAVKDARIAELEASQRPVEIREIPDTRLPEVLALNRQQADTLKNTGEAIKQVVSESDRLRVAALMLKQGTNKSVQSFLWEICDYSLALNCSAESDESLMSALDAILPGVRMGARGQMAKATLAARNIDYSGPRSTRPTYRDVFDEADGKYQEEL
jgi:hypothetical protein